MSFALCPFCLITPGPASSNAPALRWPITVFARNSSSNSPLARMKVLPYLFLVTIPTAREPTKKKKKEAKKKQTVLSKPWLQWVCENLNADIFGVGLCNPSVFIIYYTNLLHICREGRALFFCQNRKKTKARHVWFLHLSEDDSLPRCFLVIQFLNQLCFCLSTFKWVKRQGNFSKWDVVGKIEFMGFFSY